MKKWIINNQDEREAKALAASAGVSEFAARLLINRGVSTRDGADKFFNGNSLSSPFDIADMKKAADILWKAVRAGDKITVYGDYDCDGVASVSILYNYLEAIGAEADWYIPSRDEGYGLNVKAIDKIAESGTKLIVTVDNGISAAEEVEYAKGKGLEVIITDHHQPPESLPDAAAVTDPHRKDDYCTCKELAGCGVALKLAIAMEGDEETIMDQYSDIAAIGTVGDLVPLTGENRVIVKRGLANLVYTENQGLRRLMRKCGFEDGDRITSARAAFTLCPRINAAGRFSHAKEAAELLLCEDERMLPAMADRLDTLNAQRKEEENRIWNEILDMAGKDSKLLDKRVLIFSGKNWHHGVVGIVASRITEKFGKPSAVVTEEKDGTLKGSARSVEGFSIFKMLSALSEHFIRWGGHAGAGGFTLKPGALEAFIAAADEYARKNFPDMPADIYRAEMRLSASDITVENAKALDFFEPFGEGNPTPSFVMENCRVTSKKPLKDGKYLSFAVDFQGKEFRILDFHSTYEDFKYNINDRADILVSLSVNDFNDRRTVAVRLEDIRPAGFDQDKYFAALRTYEKISLGEKVPLSLAKRVIPDKSAQKAVYDCLRAESRVSAAAESAMKKGINYCMFRAALEAFEGAGLVKTDFARDRFELVKTDKKADVEARLDEIRAKMA